MIEEIRQKLSDFMKISKKSQRQISKEIGLSSSVISQFIKGIYTGNNEEVALTIQRYLEVGNKRLDEKSDVEFYKGLENTQQVLFATSYAHKACDISLIFGDAGAGKTTALKHYSQNNTGVLFITANASSRTAKSILYMITEALGKKPASSEFMLMRNLVSDLKDTNRLIIIDEADHLCTRALQAVRNLNDEAGVGIVFSGNDRIYHQMYGRGSMQFDQLRTRTIRTQVTNNYTVEEISNIFVNCDNDCIAYLLKIACQESLRTARKCYNVALQYAKSCNSKLTLKHLKNTQKQLFNQMI